MQDNTFSREYSAQNTVEQIAICTQKLKEKIKYVRALSENQFDTEINQLSTISCENQFSMENIEQHFVASVPFGQTVEFEPPYMSGDLRGPKIILHLSLPALSSDKDRTFRSEHLTDRTELSNEAEDQNTQENRNGDTKQDEDI